MNKKIFQFFKDIKMKMSILNSLHLLKISNKDITDTD